MQSSSEMIFSHIKPLHKVLLALAFYVLKSNHGEQLNILLRQTTEHNCSLIDSQTAQKRQTCIR